MAVTIDTVKQSSQLNRSCFQASERGAEGPHGRDKEPTTLFDLVALVFFSLFLFESIVMP
jgi:hypothetical protein